MKVLDFLSPTKLSILVLVLLILLVPVFYVYYEPERTNYLPGEKQTYLVKTRFYPGSLQEYVFHKEGSLDLLWGILSRNYIHNLNGPVLVLVYYFLASGFTWTWKKFRRKQ